MRTRFFSAGHGRRATCGASTAARTVQISRCHRSGHSSGGGGGELPLQTALPACNAPANRGSKHRAPRHAGYNALLLSIFQEESLLAGSRRSLKPGPGQTGRGAFLSWPALLFSSLLSHDPFARLGSPSGFTNIKGRKYWHRVRGEAHHTASDIKRTTECEHGRLEWGRAVLGWSVERRRGSRLARGTALSIRARFPPWATTAARHTAIRAPVGKKKRRACSSAVQSRVRERGPIEITP